MLSQYQKIIELVKSKQLDITTVSLAAITNEFIKAPPTNPRELADFIIVAAKLILIKSKALLPSLELTDEEEKDIQALEEHLKIYQKFKLASKNIEKLWSGNASWSRTHLADKQIIFLPPKKLTPEELLDSFKKVMEKMQKAAVNWQSETKMVKIKIIPLESKIKELIRRLAKSNSQKFSQLTDGRPKKEIIATFLAILHLLKDKIIKINQSQKFNEIIIKKYERE